MVNSVSSPGQSPSFLSSLKGKIRDTLGIESGPAEGSQAPPSGEPEAATAPAGDRFLATGAAPKLFAGALPILNRLTGSSTGSGAVTKFVQDTADFRDAVDVVRTVASDLAGVQPTDPRREALQAELAAAETSLKARYGYTLSNSPRPGAMWVAPGLISGSGQDVEMHASKFPTRAAVTTPPSAMDAAFNNRSSLTLLEPSGQPIQIDSPQKYRELIAKHRAEAGIDPQGGEPKAVHISFAGGGGKGKRYVSTVSEMMRLGVVPASLTGTSAGSIAAAVLAAGGDPAEADRFMKDPRVAKMQDVSLTGTQGGLMKGQVSFDLFDQELRKLTGIQDRPVTFADLKVPLQIVASTMSDSQPPAGKRDLTQIENRIFVFSQETTPDTPVALAMRASMAIPGAFDPVRMADPVTGRQVTLVDGGVLDNLPMGYNRNGLPSVGISLAERGSNHPEDHAEQPHALPAGSIDVDHIVTNGVNGLRLLKAGAVESADFRDRTQPRPGQFMLSVPCWDLENPSQANTTMGFAFDPKLDPKLNHQSAEVTRNFFRQCLGKLDQPGACATNTASELPPDLNFTAQVQANGRSYTATYTGGDTISFVSDRGEAHQATLGKKQIETMYLDHQAFGDLDGQLRQVLNGIEESPMKVGFRGAL